VAGEVELLADPAATQMLDPSPGFIPVGVTTFVHLGETVVGAFPGSEGGMGAEPPVVKTVFL
jgi:hypothetical protein